MFIKFKNFLKNKISYFRRKPLKAAGMTILSLVLALALLGAALYPIYGADSDDLDEEIEAAEEEAEELEDELEDAEAESEELEEKIGSLNEELSSLSESIEELNSQITQKESEIASLEEEIAQKEENIEETQESADEQYESLKTWIKVSYENDFDSLIMTVGNAGSFSEFLSQVEYVQSLSEFGMNLIERYNNTLEDLEDQKAELEEQSEILNQDLADLNTLEEETAEKKAQVSSSIEEAQESLEDLGDEIESLEEEIEEQKAYEEELEAEKAAQAAALYAELLAQEAENTAEAVVSTDESDLTLLAALIYCEAGGESYTGQVAVGCVVMNRVRSSYYPNTVSGVIYQSNQFSPVASGRLATTLANGLATESCYEAASYVLAGNLPYPDFLCFCSASMDLGFETTVIGNHQFY